MKKSTLETFIKKYNLNGSIESVKLIVKDKQLQTSAITDDKNLLASVKLSDFTALEDIEIGLYDTAKLKQMLSVLKDDIEICTNTKNGKITSLQISDDSTTVQYVTADLSVIAQSPSIKKLPTFNVEIETTEKN